MTPAEIVAVKLFGWRATEAPSGLLKSNRYYSHPDLCGFVGVADSYTDTRWLREGEWPDFTDERLAWYWIRRVEDALAEKGLIDEYVLNLWRSRVHGDEWIAKSASPDWVNILRATAPQRLEAAIRVVEEAGL